jgi:predicted dehydrogenase
MSANRKVHGISRRQFLGTAAALAVAGKASAQGKSKSDKQLRVGVIGGRFGLSFYWQEHPNSRVTAVCDLIAERQEAMKRTFLCDKAYTDWRELARDPNVDAVAVFTPAPLHVEMAVGALEAGKHVISAVPAGINEEECARLLDAVKRSGKQYMMAETSFYRREIITARQWAAEGKFGEIFNSESEYHHDGLEGLWWDPDGSTTWRFGLPPMLYPTHCTGMIVPVTGERLTEVVCTGWDDKSGILDGNPYDNPFISETAFFKTSGGHSARVAVWWKVASGGTERGTFYGSEMSFALPRPGGPGAVVSRREKGQEIKNNYSESKVITEEMEVGDHYELLPEPLRHDSGHGGSHTHITHEFVSACLENRSPTVNVHEALAYTIPGIIAHQSALEGGTLKKIPDYGRG